MSEADVEGLVGGNVLGGQLRDEAEGLVELEVAGQVDQGPEHELCVGAGSVQGGQGDVVGEAGLVFQGDVKVGEGAFELPSTECVPLGCLFKASVPAVNAVLVL